MNRQQRRQAGIKNEIANVVDMPAGTMLRGKLMTTGTVYIIPGFKKNHDGSLNTNCPAGEETEFIANIVESH